MKKIKSTSEETVVASSELSKNRKPISKARQITPNTRNRLFALSGNQCAFPSCIEKYVKLDRAQTMLEICHIEGAEPGGERYNPNSNDEYRRSFENLVLLCPNHHVETDDVIKFTVEVMKEIKNTHEAKLLQISSSEGILKKYPSALAEIINYIGSTHIFNSPVDSGSLNSVNPSDKIEYNNVKKYKPIIEEYSAYQGKLSVIYREIEQQGSYIKEQLLQNIKWLYLNAKSEVLIENYTTEDIQEEADNLIEKVQEGLWRLIEKSSNLSEKISYEAINLSVSVILVDAFMRCKILEEPPKK